MISGSHMLSTAPTSSPTQTGFFSDDTKNLSVCTIAEMRMCALARSRKVGTYPWILFYHAIGYPRLAGHVKVKHLSDSFMLPRANRPKATKIGMFSVSTMPTYTTGLKIRPGNQFFGRCFYQQCASAKAVTPLRGANSYRRRCFERLKSISILISGFFTIEYLLERNNYGGVGCHDLEKLWRQSVTLAQPQQLVCLSELKLLHHI